MIRLSSQAAAHAPQPVHECSKAFRFETQGGKRSGCCLCLQFPETPASSFKKYSRHLFAKKEVRLISTIPDNHHRNKKQKTIRNPPESTVELPIFRTTAYILYLQKHLLRLLLLLLLLTYIQINIPCPHVSKRLSFISTGNNPDIP